MKNDEFIFWLVIMAILLMTSSCGERKERDEPSVSEEFCHTNSYPSRLSRMCIGGKCFCFSRFDRGAISFPCEVYEACVIETKRINK